MSQDFMKSAEFHVKSAGFRKTNNCQECERGISGKWSILIPNWCHEILVMAPEI